MFSTFHNDIKLKNNISSSLRKRSRVFGASFNANSEYFNAYQNKVRPVADFNPSSPSLSVGGTTNTNILPTSGDPCDGDPNDPDWISPIICGQVGKGAGCNPVENHCQNGGICLNTKQHQNIVLSSFHYKCFNNSIYEEGSRDGGNFDLCKPENNDCQVNYICTNTIFPSGSIYSACKNSSGTSSTGASPAPGP